MKKKNATLANRVKKTKAKFMILKLVIDIQYE